MQDKLRGMMLNLLNDLKHLPERVTDPRWMDTEEDGTK